VLTINVLVESLYQLKENNARQVLWEFPRKDWTKCRKVHVYKTLVHNVSDLKQRVIDTWGSIPQSIVDKAVDTWGSIPQSIVDKAVDTWGSIPQTIIDKAR